MNQRPVTPLPIPPPEHPRDKLYLFLEAERHRQDKHFGQQDHPNGTGDTWAGCSRDTREACEENFKLGLGTWADILLEEVYEALAESEPAKLAGELVQCGAVILAWLEAIERQPVEVAA